MSEEDLENVLAGRDSNALRNRILQFVSTHEGFEARESTNVVQHYLTAFCDHTRPAPDRRWIGLALRKMLAAHSSLVQEVNNGTTDLSQLGQILLRNTETEETKIVAGLVIREALESGVEFANCWPSDRAPNSNPYFPRGDESWMQDFQSFLDVFEDLKMVHPTTDPAVLYAVSVMANDGYKWRDTDATTPIVLIQNEMLTIIAPDRRLRDISFIDVPLTHVEGTSPRKTTLHDSQALGTTHEPWDLVLALKGGRSTFRVDATEHTASELTILFQSREDAQEASDCILEKKPKNVSRARMSSSKDFISIPRLNGVSKQNASGSRPEMTDSSRQNTEDLHIIISSDDRPDVLSEEEIEEAGPPSDHNDHTPSATLHGPEPVVSDQQPASNKRKSPVVSEVALPSKPAIAEVAQGSKPLSGTKETQPVDNENPDSEDDGTSPLAETRSGLVRTRPKQYQSRQTSSQPVRASEAFPRHEGKASKLPKISKKRKRIVSEEREEDPTAIFEVPNVKPASHPNRKSKAAVKAKRNDAPFKDSGNAIENPRATSGNSMASRKRQKRGTAAMVNYNESSSENSEDSSVESDYRAPAAKKKKRSPLVSKPAPNPKVQKKQDAKSQVTVRKAESKRKEMPRSQKRSVSPKKHAVLSTLLDAAGSSQKDQTKRTTIKPTGENLRERKFQMAAKKEKGTFVGVETPSVRRRLESSSEVRTLNRLFSDEEPADDHLDDSGTAQVPLEEVMSSGHSNNGIGLKNIPSTPAVDTVEEDMPLAVPVSKKRPAQSPPPSTPTAKRSKRDHSGMDDFLVNGKTASQHRPMTMAPPRRLHEPCSPCAETALSRRSSGGRTPHQALLHADDELVDVAEDEEGILPGPTPSRRISLSKGVVVVTNGCTPQQQLVEHEQVTGSAKFEILSSNSKPLPAHPVAESTAISGHADGERVEFEREMGDYETEKSNPFSQCAPAKKTTHLTRQFSGEERRTVEFDTSPSVMRAQKAKAPRPVNASANDVPVIMSVPLGDPNAVAKVPRVRQCQESPLKTNITASPSNWKYMTPIQRRRSSAPKEAVEVTQALHQHPVLDADVDVDGDTLVANQDDLPSGRVATPIKFNSSPLRGMRGLASSNHSSTSAGSTPPSERACSVSAGDEDAEWENSLRPDQRAIGDQLHRISKRVLRHIVDQETAVDDIANTFAEDGEYLLDEYVKKHSGQCEAMFKEVEQKKKAMRDELLNTAKRVKAESDRYR